MEQRKLTKQEIDSILDALAEAKQPVVTTFHPKSEMIFDPVVPTLSIVKTPSVVHKLLH